MKRNSILLVALACALAPLAAAQTVKTLLTFNGGTESEGNLTFDSAGNLYGTTGDQYDPSLITVFELSPAVGGTWTEKVIWTSTGGSEPINIRAGVAFDASGNLYGTSRLGGAYGCGTVFELVHEINGSWHETNLFNFDCGASGKYPIGGVTFGTEGKLYGTASEGGAFGMGLVYDLAPDPGGKWTEHILYSFTGGSDGEYPDHPNLIIDPKGNLYGSATLGGQGKCPIFGGNACGTIFKLTPHLGAPWVFTVLHTFTGLADGGNPDGTLVFGRDGSLYGTTVLGGKNGFGVAFQLVPADDGKWNEQVLHAFAGGADGTYPIGGLILDQAGNLYGDTGQGGNSECGLDENPIGCGVVYELSPGSGGSWTEVILARLDGSPNSTPYNDLVMDSLGNLYGSAAGYDTYSSGSEYEVVRQAGCQ